MSVEDVFDFYDEPPPRKRKPKNGKPKPRKGWKRPPPYVPTPEEIRIGCLEIQANWTPTEERIHRNDTYASKTPLPQSYGVASVQNQSPQFSPLD